MPDGYTSPPLEGTSQRQPPCNIQAEQALLGGLLANNKVAYERVADFLLPEHFYDPVHQRIYQAIVRRIDAGQLADAVTLKMDFESTGVLDEVGGTQYLAQLLTAMIGVINVGDYGRTIHETWLRRKLIEYGENTVELAFRTDDAGKLLKEADAGLTKVEDSFQGKGSKGPVTVLEAFDKAIASGEAAAKGQGPTSVSTGIPDLDRLILRLRAGKLYVIGGRPGMGKTALARSFAVNVARPKTHPDTGEVEPGALVVYFSMEEDEEAFGAGIVAQMAGIPIGTTLAGGWNPREVRAIGYARGDVAQMPLEIIPGKVSIVDINRHCRTIQRKHRRKIGMVVVDYLQLMSDPPGHRGDKRIATGENAYGLKHLSGEYECPVVLLSQLSRAVEETADKRPDMRHLREAGQIEDAADVVMFPFRQEYYLLNDRPKQDFAGGETLDVYNTRLSGWREKMASLEGHAEILIPKVRGGRAPVHLEVFFDAEATRFTALPPIR